MAAALVAALVQEGRILQGNGLWRDETLCLAIARSPSLGELFAFLHFHESHPPLFYLVLRGWEALVGQADLTARLPSVAAELGLVGLAYWLAGRLFGPMTAGFAALLVAVSPAMLQQGAMVRPYALEALLITGAAACLWRGRWWGYGPLVLAAVYMHHWAWLPVAALMLVGLWLPPRRDAAPGAPGWAPREAAAWLGLHALVVLAYAPWAPILAYQVSHAGHGVAWEPTFGPGFWAFFAAPWGLGWDWVALLPWLLVLGLAAREGNKQALALCFGVPLASLGLALALTPLSTLLIPWCYGMVLPLLLIGAARALALACELQPAAGLALTALVVLGLYVPEAKDPPRISNARQLAHWIARQARPDDLVLVVPEVLASSFNHYYTPSTRQIDFPAMAREELVPFDDQLHRWSDPVAFAQVQQALAGARAAGRRVWLVGNLLEKAEPQPGFDQPELPAAYRMSAPLVGYYRANQLTATLTRLYGQPDPRRMLVDRAPRNEMLYAVLYEVAPGKNPQAH